AAAEAVRNLRTSVMLSNIDQNPQVLMMTSSVPQEGKSTTLLMLAQITAQMGKRTLVVESDIRRPSFKRALGLEGKRGILSGGRNRDSEAAPPGLLSVLSRQAPIEEVVYSDDELGVDILFSQRTKVNAA